MNWIKLRLTKELYVSHWYKAADDTRFVAPRSQTDTEITSSTQLFLWNGFRFRCAIIKHILVEKFLFGKCGSCIYLSSYPGYFQEPYWLSMGLLEISRVTWQVCNFFRTSLIISWHWFRNGLVQSNGMLYILRLVQINFMNNLQDYFTGTEAIIWLSQ